MVAFQEQRTEFRHARQHLVIINIGEEINRSLHVFRKSFLSSKQFFYMEYFHMYRFVPSMELDRDKLAIFSMIARTIFIILTQNCK